MMSTGEAVCLLQAPHAPPPQGQPAAAHCSHPPASPQQHPPTSSIRSSCTNTCSGPLRSALPSVGSSSKLPLLVLEGHWRTPTLLPTRMPPPPTTCHRSPQGCTCYRCKSRGSTGSVRRTLTCTPPYPGPAVVWPHGASQTPHTMDQAPGWGGGWRGPHLCQRHMPAQAMQQPLTPHPLWYIHAHCICRRTHTYVHTQTHTHATYTLHTQGAYTHAGVGRSFGQAGCSSNPLHPSPLCSTPLGAWAVPTVTLCWGVTSAAAGDTRVD